MTYKELAEIIKTFNPEQMTSQVMFQFNEDLYEVMDLDVWHNNPKIGRGHPVLYPEGDLI